MKTVQDLQRHFEQILESAFQQTSNSHQLIDALIRACGRKEISLRDLEAGIMRERRSRI